MVTWAFAVAGSSLTPVFLLSVWWRKTTAQGVLAGMVIGAMLSIGAVALAVVARPFGWAEWMQLGHFPSLVAAPLATAGTVFVSLRGVAPATASAWRVRIHGTAPERRQAILIRLAAREGGIE